MNPLALVAAARPGLTARLVEETHELVLHGGGEVFRLPLTEQAVARHALLVRALPALAVRLPVAVPRPRYVGVMDDGSTPFTAEPRLPGERMTAPPDGIALGQLAGLLLALRDVPAKEAQQWGAAGDRDLHHAVLLHGALTPSALLADPARGVLTGVVDWRPRLGEPAEDVRSLGVDPLG
ncbi:MAG: hypothetical protein ABR614_02165 [Mycobacteriales bacterium]